jgi:c-di-GMP-related signal transduction protein
VNTVLGFGLDELLGGKPVFINFDRALLLENWTALLPPDKVVIEILGSVPPDSEILSALDKLRKQGYALALHDCTDEGRIEAFAPFLDILKVDFEQTSPADQERLVRLYRKLNIGMVAENFRQCSTAMDARSMKSRRRVRRSQHDAKALQAAGGTGENQCRGGRSAGKNETPRSQGSRRTDRQS